jgi:hypothetical protein
VWPSGIGEERHPQVVVVHLGDQVRFGREGEVATAELVHRQRNIGAAEMQPCGLRLPESFAFSISSRTPAHR